MEQTLIYQIIKYLGFLLLLIAYSLLSIKKIKPRKLFQTLNFFGALGIIVGSVYLHDWVLFTIGILWILIAIPILIRLFTPNKEYKDWTY